MQEGFKKSDIEILVATMNRDSLDFLASMFPFIHFSQFNILVINQTSESKILKSDYPSVRVINSFEKGLSKSRNLALSNAKGVLLLITDDDVIFEPDFADKIITAYNNSSEAALISFRVKTPQGKLFKKYPGSRVKNPGYMQFFNIMSVEMVINKKHLGDVKFDECFGLGSKFPMGEEAVFINELYSKKRLIVMEPETIVIHPEITTNSKVSVQEKYYIQGAFYTRLFGSKYYKWLLLKIVFDLKQQKIKLAEINTAFKYARLGSKDLLSLHEDND